MGITLQQKRALIWGAVVLATLVLINVAWAQIASALGHCFSPF